MRVLVTGAGGVLGSRVAQLLAEDPAFKAVVGIDYVAPRRPAGEFRIVDPRDRRRTLAAVRDVEPEAIAHLGVYEPDARSSPRTGQERTSAGTVAVLGAAARLGSLRRVVVRSGVEVYGRSRGAPTVPDESVPPLPTSPFGHSLLAVEGLAATTGREVGATVAALRLSPMVGHRFPSPLSRLLRLRAVPFSALADPAFSVLHVDDAAAAIVAALRLGFDGPLNVTGSGAVTASQAARLGGRIPLPVAGPQWALARAVCGRVGAPVPDHLMELLMRGRAADASRSLEVLGVRPRSTRQAIEDLYASAAPPALRVLEGAA